jgi:hypothetical protein
MSYDIKLLDPITKNVIEFEHGHHMRGGTYAVGGSTEAWLNITYNYSPHYYKALGVGGIRKIYGMTGAQSIDVLREAIGKLGDDVKANYWESSEGNAKRPLCQLLALAEQRPDGIWDGD